MHMRHHSHNGSGAGAGVAIATAAVGFVAGLAASHAKKAVVQGPSIAAGDWVDALKVEHRLVEGLFEKLMATTDQDAGKRNALLGKIAYALTKHGVEEENTVYPALRAVDEARAKHLFEDHAEIKGFLYDLKTSEAGSADWLERARAFQACVQHHIREEEDEIFPFFHARMTEEENARLTAALNWEGFKVA